MPKNAIEMPDAEQAIPGRMTEMPISGIHYVNQNPMKPPFPGGFEKILLGMGCFWGAERTFWSLKGVYSTAVGYAAGYTKNPRYEEVCSGRTGHNEVVLVVWEPEVTSLKQILIVFWESHDPTQGMRQGNDVGTQYRSGIYFENEAQKQFAKASRSAYQARLHKSGYGEITTEIVKAGTFYYAEEYHQQYLAKNPGGYCGLGGTGVRCSTGTDAA